MNYDKKHDGYQVAKKIAAEDAMGKALQDLSLKKRERSSQKNKVWKDLSMYWFWLAKEIRTDWRAKLRIFSMLGYRRIAFNEYNDYFRSHGFLLTAKGMDFTFGLWYANC